MLTVHLNEEAVWCDGVICLLGCHFITITKNEDFLWEHIKPALLGTIMDFPILGKNLNRTLEIHHTKSRRTDTEIKKITDLLDTRVRPAVAQDVGYNIPKFQEGWILAYARSLRWVSFINYDIKNGY